MKMKKEEEGIKGERELEAKRDGKAVQNQERGEEEEEGLSLPTP